MRAVIRSVVVVLVALSIVPADAGVQTSTLARRAVAFAFGWYDPQTSEQTSGGLWVQVDEGATSAGTSATPSTSYQATGYILDCDSMSCSQMFFNWQTINLTGLTMDPLANSATVDVCLLPSTGGNCVNFDLTFTRPQTLYPTSLCFPLGICGVNAWWDPGTNQAQVSISSQPGIARTGYTVAGVFAGSPLVLPPNSYVESVGMVHLLLGDQVGLP